MELMHILYSYKKVLWTERATIAISAHEVPDTYLERDKGNERVRMPMLSFFRQVSDVHRHRGGSRPDGNSGTPLPKEHSPEE